MFFQPTAPIQFDTDVREVIRAFGIKVNGLVSFAESVVVGGICLYQAELGGNLLFQDCRILNEGRCAVLATGATITGALFMGLNVAIKGSVNLQFVTVKGNVEFEKGRITHCPEFQDKFAQGTAINLEHADIKGLLCFRNGFVVVGKTDLQGATIGSHLDCQGSQFLNEKGLAILGNNARVSNGVLLRKKFRSEGEVRFFSASIGGNLECDSGEFSNSGDTALDAERARIGGHLFLRSGFRADGRVRFYAATIGGDMSCDGGNFANPDGVALDIGSAEVNGSASLGVGFESRGTVSLLRAKIRKLEEICNALRPILAAVIQRLLRARKFGVPIRYALHAESTTVNGSILIRGMIMPDNRLNALVSEGTVSFFNSKVGSNVVFFGCGLSKVDGDALVMEGMQIGAALVLGPLIFVNGSLILRRMRLAATCAIFGFVEAEKITSLDLRFTVAKTIEHRPDGWPSAGTLHLDGLLYDSIGPEVPINQASLIQWLRLQPKKPISLQPYEQLAKALRLTGYEREATQVLIAKQDDLLSYGALSPASKFWKILLKYVVAYGYKPHQALLWVALFLLLGTILFQAGHDHGLITKTKNSSGLGQTKDVYPEFHALIYSAEFFIPFVDLRQRSYWAPAESKGHAIMKCFCGKLRWGYLLTIYFWLQTCVGWALTTIWVAGFTGIVRKLN